jgi:hypothetical protein
MGGTVRRNKFAPGKRGGGEQNKDRKLKTIK